jgi:hypothetical protein
MLENNDTYALLRQLENTKDGSRLKNAFEEMRSLYELETAVTDLVRDVVREVEQTRQEIDPEDADAFNRANRECRVSADRRSDFVDQLSELRETLQVLGVGEGNVMESFGEMRRSFSPRVVTELQAERVDLHQTAEALVTETEVVNGEMRNSLHSLVLSTLFLIPPDNVEMFYEAKCNMAKLTPPKRPDAGNSLNPPTP